MAETQYTYDVTTEFPGGKVNPGTLQTEIQASGIVTALERIDSAGGSLALGTLSGGSIAIVFKDALSAGDVTVLDGDATGPAGGLIAAHNNSPVQSTPTQREDGVLYSVPKPSSFGFEMCDRDFRITPGKFAQADSVADLYMDPTTRKEIDWGELLLAGVYKDVAGTMTACTDQADADEFGTLSVWNYSAKLANATEIAYEMRDGILYPDPTLPANERWDHRAYALIAPDIPNAYGGSVAVFDGYLGATPDGKVEALSPQATILNPALGAGASVVRLYIVHPVPGVTPTYYSHVLRLVTYRQPTTFR